MAEFHAPPARTPEQLMQLVMQLVNQAAERGQTEVQIYRFPYELHGSRPEDQQLGIGLGEDFGGPAQAWLRVLARPPKTARLWS